MSEYTPTTEEIIHAWHYFASENRTYDGDAEEEVGRWLAAHDAEVRARGEYYEGFEEGIKVGRAEARAGVVAEEPEWEYTRQAEANGWAGPAAYRDEAHASDGLMPGWRVVRRRKAGPWVPVKQEAAG